MFLQAAQSDVSDQFIWLYIVQLDKLWTKV